jgi:uncharacterized membrane protein (UPF0127 family)
MIGKMTKSYLGGLKIPQRFLWAFVPWPVFWQQNGSMLQDQAAIRIGLSVTSACTEIDKVYRGTVATRITTQEYGLSHRTQPLKSDDAMLFVNSKPKTMSFWMLKTYIPLDIVYYDSTGFMRGVHFMPVESDPLHPKSRYRSQTKIQVSIEMKPGAHERLWSHPHLCVDVVSK